MSVVRVIMKDREGDESPKYVTICMAGHYVGRDDGIMTTSCTWDATKFTHYDKDAELFCDYLNRNAKTGTHYLIVDIDERHLAAKKHEYWGMPSVHTHFKDDHIFKGEKLF